MKAWRKVGECKICGNPIYEAGEPDDGTMFGDFRSVPEVARTCECQKVTAELAMLAKKAREDVE